MVKVSFIAIFLAAIGYKEYNPSVVGKWELKERPLSQIYFFDDDQCVKNYIIQTTYYPKDDFDTSTYEFRSQILKANIDYTGVKSYRIIHQNKRKLILQPIDSLETKKIIYKRIK